MENFELQPSNTGEIVPVGASRERLQSAYPAGETIDVEFADDTRARSLLEYWRLALSHKGILLLAALTGLGGGLLLTMAQIPVYQARSSIEIQGINEDFLRMRDLNPNDSNNPSFPEVDMRTQANILQSQSLIERAVDSLNLGNRTLPTKENPLLPDWRKALGLAPAKPQLLRENMLASAAHDLKVRFQPNTRIIEIRYDAADPLLAADFTNALTSKFIEQTRESRWEATQHTGEWLAKRMQALKAKLEKSERQLQNYAHTSGLEFTSEKENAAEEKLRHLQLELSKAQADRIAKQARYELASSAPPEALPEVLDDTTLRQYQVDLTNLRRQVAELSSSLTPENPRVVKLQSQVTLLQSAVDRERANITRRITNEFEAARRREALLRADYEGQARVISDQAAQVAHYNIQKREVDSTRQIYDSMLQRVTEAAVASALRASNIRVIDCAVPPKAPYKPRRVMNASIGLLIGFSTGFAALVARKSANRNIEGPGEVRTYLALPELGVIPSCERGLSGRLLRRGEAQPPVTSVVGGSQHPALTNRVELITYQQRLSLVAECFRSVLTSIVLSGTNGNRPRVLALTSALPGDGKTMLASNLAIALAESGLRVLLVDGDLRRPRLHTIFEMGNRAGLSDLLANPAKSTLADVVRPTSVPKLFILTSGSKCDPDLVHSPRLKDLLKDLQAKFDIVLIDTPPMLLIPDARILARLADAAVLVVRSGQTTRDAALLASQRLVEDGCKLLGTVLNDWQPNTNDRFGYGGYYKKAGQYYSKKTPIA